MSEPKQDTEEHLRKEKDVKQMLKTLDVQEHEAKKLSRETSDDQKGSIATKYVDIRHRRLTKDKNIIKNKYFDEKKDSKSKFVTELLPKKDNSFLESSYESDESLRKRHSEFVHWAKYLKECVDCFGTELEKRQILYHGVDQMMVLKAVDVRFNGPTSTTTQWGVAVNFASSNGTIIELANHKYGSVKYFDCACFSDYPSEEEKLLFGTRRFIQIMNLWDVQSATDYAPWCTALRIFENIFIRSAFLSQRISKSDIKSIRVMIESINNPNTALPEYILAMFNHCRSKTKIIQIDTNVLWNDEYLSKDGDIVFGGTALRHICFDQNENIKWKFIKILFPKIVKIKIKCHPSSRFNLTRSLISRTIPLSDIQIILGDDL